MLQAMWLLLIFCFQCTKQWFEIMQGLAAHDIPDIQHRGIFILYNMMSADEELSKQLVESRMLEILMAVSKLDDDPDRQSASKIAAEALKKAEEWKLIKSIEDKKWSLLPFVESLTSLKGRSSEGEWSWSERNMDETSVLISCLFS